MPLVGSIGFAPLDNRFAGKCEVLRSCCQRRFGHGLQRSKLALAPRARNMSITIQLDLPDALVNEARANGLLNSVPLANLLGAELRRRKAGVELNKVLEGIRAQPGKPMSEEEIQAEVKAVRRERRAREAGR